MARSFVFLSLLFASLFLGGNAWADCRYEPGKGNNPALHDVASAIPAEFQRTLELPAGTAVRTDSGTSSVLKDVGCLKHAHVVIYDSRKVVDGFISEGYLTGCLNAVTFAPVRVWRSYTDEDWVACISAARFALEDMSYGSQCAASLRCEVQQDGTVRVGQVLYEDCSCAPKAHQLSSETDLDEPLSKRVKDTPLSKLLALKAAGVTSGAAGDPPPDTITDTTIRAGVTSYFTDIDDTGLGWRLDEHWFLWNGYLDFYKPNQCEAGVHVGFEVGAGAVIVGAGDHSVLGAFGALAIGSNAVEGRIGGYIGADHATASVSGMPLLGAAGRIWESSQGRTQIWLGGDLVAPMGPTWATVGGQGRISLNTAVTPWRRPVSLGVELSAGGVGAVAGDCQSGSLFAGNIHVGF